jgi:pimeloyl-ACP methyl ester carboxylesterase
MKYKFFLVLSIILFSLFQSNPIFAQEKVNSKYNRPQTPKPPFPYQAIEVNYQVPTDTSVHLAATLTLPEGKAPFPAILIIGGSGQTSRDQPFYEHRMMLVLADYLTKQGYATLRFDDRGAGKSTAGSKKMRELVEEDFIADAAAGIDFLKKHVSIDPNKIGVVGQSAGAGQGLALACQKDKNLKFAIMLAGAAALPPHTIVAHQSKMVSRWGGNSAIAQQADSNFVNRSIYYTKNEPSYERRFEAIKKTADEELAKIPQPEREKLQKGFASRTHILSSEQFYKAAQEKKKDLLLEVTCPVLIINGDKDVLVDGPYHNSLMKASLKKNFNKKSEIHLLKDINHMLQKANTGLTEESEFIEETINPEILSIVGKWLVK